MKFSSCLMEHPFSRIVICPALEPVELCWVINNYLINIIQKTWEDKDFNGVYFFHILEKYSLLPRRFLCIYLVTNVLLASK